MNLDYAAEMLFSKIRTVPSRRPCPDCGGQMQYVATVLPLLFGADTYRRRCKSCSYEDAMLVRMVKY